MKRKKAGLLGGLLLCLAVALPAQESPPPDASDLVNTLLSGLLGFRDVTGAELQREVADVGGVPFRSDVPLEYMSRADLSRYLKEVLDSEYPEARARNDQRTLVAFDLLPPETDLRALRAHVLEENIAGFYDERPGKKRLYAVSEDRRLTPANQLILAHELRHALQDQYVDVHQALPASVGDFDDRRIAWMSLLEGDATLVMERFLMRRLPGGEEGLDLPGLSVPTPEVPGAPPVVRDQLVLPYLVGREFARALWRNGGAEAIRSAWSRPPESTEQVLHPDKYAAREAPRPVEPPEPPRGGRLVNEGVLGELLVRTLLDDPGDEGAGGGWGGDVYRVWDLSGKTLLVWRSVWDSPQAEGRFLGAVRARFYRRYGVPEVREGYTVFGRGPWRFAIGRRAHGILLVSSDDGRALGEVLRAMPSSS